MKKRASLLIAICVIAMMLFASTSVFAAAPFEGSGTESDPYLIQNYEDLCKLSELVLIEEGGYASAHYLQTANIVANEGTFSLAKDGTPLYNGTEITLIYEKYDEYDEYGHIVGAKEVDLWQPIEYFNGSYDGGGFYISGIYVETGIYDDAGFILHTESAKISNFHLKNSVIRNSHKDSGITGGITAYAYSSEFKNCTVNAFVTNYHQTGSICSDATGCAFTNCINEGTVTTINRTDTATSSGYCGGICGKASYCEITSCENNGTVVGDTNVGGICGTLTDINKMRSGISSFRSRKGGITTGTTERR